MILKSRVVDRALETLSTLEKRSEGVPNQPASLALGSSLLLLTAQNAAVNRYGSINKNGELPNKGVETLTLPLKASTFGSLIVSVDSHHNHQLPCDFCGSTISCWFFYPSSPEAQ